MIFNDLKVSVALLISGGLETILQNKTDAQIQNTERSVSLELIKNDLKIELGESELDFDYIATNYDYLIIEALRLLQRYNIIIKYGDISFDGSVAKEQSEQLYKDYQLLKAKFRQINLNEKKRVISITVSPNYR
jgi:hypothetical protein